MRVCMYVCVRVCVSVTIKDFETIPCSVGGEAVRRIIDMLVEELLEDPSEVALEVTARTICLAS